MKGGSDASARSARSVLWTALHAFPLSMGERCCGGGVRHDPSLSARSCVGRDGAARSSHPALSSRAAGAQGFSPLPFAWGCSARLPGAHTGATFAVGVLTALLLPCSLYP